MNRSPYATAPATSQFASPLQLLCSLAASLAVPVYLLLRDGARLTPVLGFALACAALVIYTHRGNVRRMRQGVEPRARRLWLFGRGRA